MEDWLMMMLSSWLYPVKQAMAVMGLAPLGICCRDRYLEALVMARARWG
jgi:integral membrane sensor domain MASE1